MLGLNYKNEDELNKEIFSGKLQREIFNYIKEISLNHEIYPEMCTNDMSQENIYDYFDAEVGDECISYEKICSPGINKYATIFHDLIKAVYEEFLIEKTLWEKNNYKEVTIDVNMDSTELYKMITFVTTFEKIEEGHYLDYIRNFDFNYKDAEKIYASCHRAWLKIDSDISLDYIISSACESILEKKVKLDEVTMMTRYNLLDAIFHHDFEQYTTLHYNEVLDSTLDEVLRNPDLSVIYNLKREDANQFVSLYEADKKRVPKVMIVSGNLAIDNSEGDCFIEEFGCHEKALKWVEGCTASVENVEEIFSTYEKELEHEEFELSL